MRRTFTGVDSIGRAVTLHFTPGSRVGSAWVMLDKDPGTGPMSYADSIDQYRITGGGAEDLAELAEWGRQRFGYGRDDVPWMRALTAWVSEVERLAS